MLNVEHLSGGYDQIQVLRDVTLRIEDGEVVSIIGANGAGKSTLLRTISGVVSVSSGKVVFDGNEITGRKPEDIVRAGVSQVPEGRHVFSSMSVRQNLLLGTYTRRSSRNEVPNLLDFVFDLFPVLRRKLDTKGGQLSGGEQQMLAIGRALMSDPKMLLLDEPSLGLAPIVVKQIFEVINNLRSRKISILLVEQNARSALQITDRAYVMETGTIVKEAPACALLDDDEVRKRYLGE